MKITNHISAIALLVLTLFPQSASAMSDTAGLSPASFDMVAYRGDVLSETITLMRSTSSGDLSMLVSKKDDGSSVIDLRGQDKVVIPDGSTSVEFSFDIDARDSSVGTYDNGIVFLIESPETDVTGQTLRFAMMSKVRVSIQERPDSTTVLAVDDYPTLPDDVSFSNLRVTQSSIENGRRLHLAWNAKSTGINPLRGADVEVSLYHGENKENAVTRYVVNDIPVDGPSDQSFDIDLLEPKKSGRYVAEISYQGKTLREGTWVIQPTLRAKLEALFAVFAVVTVVLCLLVVRLNGKKKSRRGSRR